MLRQALVLCLLCGAVLGSEQVGLGPFDDMWDLSPAGSMQQQHWQQARQPQPGMPPRFAGPPAAERDPFEEAFEGPRVAPAFLQQAQQQFPIGYPMPQQQQQMAYGEMMAPQAGPGGMLSGGFPADGFAQPAYPPLPSAGVAGGSMGGQDGYTPRLRGAGGATETLQRARMRALETPVPAPEDAETEAEEEGGEQEQEQAAAPAPSGDQQASVHGPVAEEKSSEPLDENTRLRNAIDAINYDIMERVNRVKKNEEWATQVKQVLITYEKKLSNVAHANDKSRREIRKLVNKKKLIKNLILQRELEGKIHASKQDLEKVTSALETVTSKSDEIEQTRREIQKTIAGIHAQLENLRGQQDDAMNDEGGDGSDSARFVQRKSVLQRLQSDIKELEQREAALEKKQRDLAAGL